MSGPRRLVSAAWVPAQRCLLQTRLGVLTDGGLVPLPHPPPGSAAGFLHGADRYYPLACRRGFAASGSAAPGTGGSGPVSFTSLALTAVTGTGLYVFYQYSKEEKRQKATEQKTVSVGKARVGGPFSLINQDGKLFTDKDLLGEFALLYFGFCTCPDICPDELEKLAAAIDAAESKTGVQVQPVFISVDPERDTAKRIKSYVKEFHPRLIGLTGSKEQVDAAAKAYRVYYMKTDDSDDYLIDHSIIMYLLDPNGDFVTFFGKNFTEEQLGEKLGSIIADYAMANPDYAAASAKKATCN